MFLSHPKSKSARQRRAASRFSESTRRPSEPRAPGDVGRNPSRLVPVEQLRGRSPARLLLEIDICEGLKVAVAHDARGILVDHPRRPMCASCCATSPRSAARSTPGATATLVLAMTLLGLRRAGQASRSSAQSQASDAWIRHLQSSLRGRGSPRHARANAPRRDKWVPCSLRPPARPQITWELRSARGGLGYPLRGPRRDRQACRNRRPAAP